MASFPASLPLSVLGSSHAQSVDSQQEHPDVEYQVVPQAPSDQTTQTAAAETADMGYDEQILKPEGRAGDVAASYAAYTSILVFVVSTWATVFASNSSDLFIWHPLLQSAAIGLISYGILTLQPTSQPKTKEAGLGRHQLAMAIIGAPVIVLGTLAIVIRKFINGSEHFTSWHGTIGIIAVVWMVFQILVGGSTVWFDGALFGGRANARAMWKYHRASGYVLFVTFLLAAYLGGTWSHWSVEGTSSPVRFLAYTVSPLVLLGAVLVRARLSKMNFA